MIPEKPSWLVTPSPRGLVLSLPTGTVMSLQDLVEIAQSAGRTPDQVCLYVSGLDLVLVRPAP